MDRYLCLRKNKEQLTSKDSLANPEHAELEVMYYEVTVTGIPIKLWLISTICSFVEYVLLSFILKGANKMNKVFNKLVSLALVSALSLTSIVNVFASDSVQSYNIGMEQTTVNVTDDGMYVGDVFYTQAEFSELLENTVAISTSDTVNSRIAIVAGAYFIPGVGQVLILATGAIVVAGATVTVGSWLYNTIVDWFTS